MGPAMIAEDTAQDPSNPATQEILAIAGHFMAQSGITPTLPPAQQPEEAQNTAHIPITPPEITNRLKDLMGQTAPFGAFGGTTRIMGTPTPSYIPTTPTKHPATPSGVGSIEQLSIEVRQLSAAIDKLCHILGAK